MNSYTGLHARVYDEVYADKPYSAEARFVHELAGAPGGKLLDVACGTGRHALAFADLGYEVTGTDVNEELLEVGRDAAGDRVLIRAAALLRPVADAEPDEDPPPTETDALPPRGARARHRNLSRPVPWGRAATAVLQRLEPRAS